MFNIENRRGNQELTIQRHWQYWAHTDTERSKPKKQSKQKQHNIRLKGYQQGSHQQNCDESWR
jgi:hypothetical protein